MAEQKQNSSNKRRGKGPKISKKDLNSFFEQDADGQDEVEVDTAISILTKALCFLKSSSEKEEPMVNNCDQRHRELFFKYAWNVLKWLGPIILGTTFFLYTEVYRDLEKKKEKYVAHQKKVEHLTRENRRILSIMGSRDGWKIEMPGPGYKTPWEAGVGKERYKEERNDGEVKDTPSRR